MKLRWSDRKELLNARVYKYGPSWVPAKKLVLARDGEKCLVCGSKDKPHVDHIVPFLVVKKWREAGLTDKKENDLVNLETLCCRHHAFKTHGEKKMKAGDALAWMQWLKRQNYPDAVLLAHAAAYRHYGLAFESMPMLRDRGGW